MIRPKLGRNVRYWYTYRTVVAIVMAVVFSGVIYWLYTQQVACDAHAGACLANISVHPEDRLFVNQTDPGNNVVIVGIDDKSVADLAHFPFSRKYYAMAIQELQKDGAASVGLDVQLSDPRDQDDKTLVDALRTTKVPVVLSYPASNLETRPGYIVQCPADEKTCLTRGSDEIPLHNFRCLDDSSTGTAPCQQPNPNVILASTDLVLDADGVLRSVPLFVQPACYPTGGCTTPNMDSFAFAAFRAAQPDFQTFPELTQSDGSASLGQAWKVSTDAKGAALVNFSGPPGNFQHYHHYVSFSDLVAGRENPDMIKGNVVLIGAYNLSGVNDAELVPSSAGSNGTIPMAGIEIHANVVYMLNGANQGLLRTPEPAWLLVLLILVLGLATAIGVARVSVLWGLVGTVLAIVLFTLAMAFVAGSSGFVPDLFHPWLAIALTYSGVTAYRFLYEDREKRKVTAIFGQYLKPEIVAQLAKTRRGVDDILRGGERRDITLLFLGIRGYTSMSASMAPADVTELVTLYLDHLSGLIFKWDGTVDKYVGDEIMAFWNAPRLQENHALLAVRCAYDLLNHAAELQQLLLSKGLPPIRWGIGINTGPAVVGNMGSRSRIQYTAHGDTVNTAARFCAHAPAFHVLIGEQTYQECKDYIAVDLVPGVQLKGKSAETFRIYQLTAIRESPASPWVPFPTAKATETHQAYTAQYTQQSVIMAGGSGSSDILVGEAAQQAMAREGISPY